MDENRFWTMIETAWGAVGGKTKSRQRLAEGRLSADGAYSLDRRTLGWRTRDTNPKRQRGSGAIPPRWRFGLVTNGPPGTVRNAFVRRSSSTKCWNK